jgi:transcriptional regulator with XRE-family HTH domain
MRKKQKTIRDLRKLKGWTQVELAHHTGVAPSTIYNWESGRFEPRVSQLRDLAVALDVTMDEIELVDEGKLAAA